MTPDIAPPPWHADAACTAHPDPEIFFPERGESTAEAKAVCFSCPVRAECQEHGLRHEKFGIWGGLSERERQVRRRDLGIEFSSVWSDGHELTEEIDLRSRGGGFGASTGRSVRTHPQNHRPTPDPIAS